MSSLRVQSMKEVYKMMTVEEKKEIFGDLLNSVKEDSFEEMGLIFETIKKLKIHHDTFFDGSKNNKYWDIPNNTSGLQISEKSRTLHVCHIMYDNESFISTNPYSSKYLLINSSGEPRKIRINGKFNTNVYDKNTTDANIELTTYDHTIQDADFTLQPDKIVYLELGRLKITYICQYDKKTFSMEKSRNRIET